MKGATRILSSILLASFTLNTPIYAKNNSLTKAETIKLGTDAYIYGYPLITMDLTRQVMTNTVKPEGTHAPMGQFMNVPSYPDASFHDVTAPNADTLYSTAWLDLKNEPYILQIPNEDQRYYLMPMLSGWTNVFSVPGKRTTGTKAQQYVIIGPDWHGKLPSGFKEVRSPTNMVWILGRTYCTGTPEDYAKVHQLQSQYKLIPLSSLGKEYTPPEGTINNNIDMKTPVRDQVDAMDAATYFDKLAMLMKDNPAAKIDATMVGNLAKLGIIPGKHFDISKLNSEAAAGLVASVKLAQEKIMQHMKSAGVNKNGWIYSTKTGSYGVDYLQRALVTAIGLGANLPQDAIYPTTLVDNKGQKLNGANRYIIHFPKGQTPPVNGFWSLTMYNSQYFFVENPLNRYSISERNSLKKNTDGSIDLYIQHDSPGQDKESNWLPAPSDDFILMFRFYWPKSEIVNGKWNLPGVELVK